MLLSLEQEYYKYFLHLNRNLSMLERFLLCIYVCICVSRPTPHQQLIDAVDSSCCSLTTQDTASLVSLAFEHRFKRAFVIEHNL